ncbi:MAG TPA: helix-turn-helix domain-containing protein [Ktedonobacterales bacterium]
METAAMEKMLVDPATAANLLSLPRTKLFVLMGQGAIKSCKIGRSRRISVKELHRFIAAHESADGDERG